MTNDCSMLELSYSQKNKKQDKKMTNHSSLEKVSTLTSLVASLKESYSFYSPDMERDEELCNKLIAVTGTGLARPKLFDLSKETAVELFNEIKVNVDEAKVVIERVNESFRESLLHTAEGIIPSHDCETSSPSDILSSLIDYINEELCKIDDVIDAIEVCESLDFNKISYIINIQKQKLDDLVTEAQRQLDSEVKVEDRFALIDSDLEEIEKELERLFDDSNRPDEEKPSKVVQVETKSVIEIDSFTQKIIDQILSNESFKQMIKDVIVSINK